MDKLAFEKPAEAIKSMLTVNFFGNSFVGLLEISKTRSIFSDHKSLLKIEPWVGRKIGSRVNSASQSEV